MTPLEEEKHVYPSADAVSDPHLATLLRLNEKLDKVLEGTSHEPAPTSTTPEL
jgi:hypothetical protein